MRTFGLISATLLASFASAGCIYHWVTGSGRAASESRAVDDFDGVSVSDGLTAAITLAPDQAPGVDIHGDDNLVRLIRSRVDAGKLSIELPPNTHIRPRLPLRVTISATRLTRVATSDSARVSVDAIDGDSVALSANDSAELDVDDVHATSRLSVSASDSGSVQIAKGAADGDVSLTATDSADITASDFTVTGKLSIRASDSSNVVLHGQGGAVDANLSDSSHCDAGEFSADAVELDATDSSSADLCATTSLRLRLSDSSHVTYQCDPGDVSQDIHDGSSVERR